MAVVGSNVAPLPEPKPTRQWDAWTREEEENFFGALRQVGKNFEKITSRVQSKNKDQVRHYYYRVIKRMNRILAPTLILDAKNSTYVHSAMLRWWSLLEKHSCSASKLRLKPRRFKTFVTALEHQLLKDHKKVKAKKPTPAAATSRRQTAHAEITAVNPPGLPGLVTSGSGGGKTSADDLQNLQTVGAGRKTSVKRKAASSGPRKTLPKGEAKRPPRPRKKATDGNLSKAAYAKWEKAASVGVSLVAEAAEQLERASAAEVIPPASDACEIDCTTTTGGNVINLDVRTGQIPPGTSAAFSELGLSDKIAKELPCGPPAERLGLGAPVSSGLSGVAGTSQAGCSSAAMSMPPPASTGVFSNVYEDGPGGLVIIPDLCAQVKAKSLALDTTRCNNCSSLRCSGSEEGVNGTTGVKLKLQLFPFDDYIRKALEQDGHNPHLELTLKARKSISSVLHHLVQKWGRSTVASGDLRLFPFSTQWSNVSACQSWSFQDLSVSAADVHAALGNPAVFRLRYAWLSNRVLESSAAVLQQPHRPASNGLEPVLLAGVCYPTPGTDSTTRQKSVQPQALVSPSVCMRNSIVSSAEQCRPSEQVQSLPVSKRACRKDGATHGVQCAVAVNTVAGVDVPGAVPSQNSSQGPSVPPNSESEHVVMDKSSGAPASTVAFRSEKEVVPPAVGRASSADTGAEKAGRSICKEVENASQVSGCAWLCESNDGFAQQLWSYEDTVRSSTGASISQMDWVDSLTNISVSELLGDPARTVFSAPPDSPHPSSGQTQLTGLDSFDRAIAAQELPVQGPMLMPSSHPSAAIFGGEDTCDAFSFQRLDRRSKETGNLLGEELCGNSLGLDITFADFRSMTCWREGDSLVALDLVQQPQHFQSQDLLFDGEASTGLGGLIEALAQGSLDEFQPCTVSHDAEERDLDEELRHGSDVNGQARASNAEARTELSSKDGRGTSASFRDLARIDELSNVSLELIGLYERLPESTSPNISLPSQDMESLKVSTPANTRLPKKKERRPPQRPFKVPGQYTTARSLKLQG